VRIGILGGSFDPVHFGHLRLAIEAREALTLDEVVLEVASRSPFKINEINTDSATRLKMVQQAVAGTDGILAGDTELKRGGVSYTVDTVCEYRERWADVWVIVGADALKGLPEWKAPGRLLELCCVGVGLRPGEDVSLTLAGFDAAWQERITVFETPLMGISSTDIRARVAGGRDIRYLTPDSVVQTIRDRRLYQ